MEHFAVPQTKFRFLICSDIDGPSATRISERFISSDPTFDAVILAGPLAHSEHHLETKEDIAVLKGDIASILAQFENIVCRVLYLPAESDPADVRLEQQHLTPNSVNFHGRQIYLTSTLRLLGYSECNEELVHAKLPGHVDRSAESDDELENVGVASGQSGSIIQEMLRNSTPSSADSSVEDIATGIFALNYRYAHTLNQLLFHMSGDLELAKVGLCIITSTHCSETDRLPTKFGKLHIAAVKSLRQGGHYSVVDIEYNAATKAWDNIVIQAHVL